MPKSLGRGRGREYGIMNTRTGRGYPVQNWCLKRFDAFMNGKTVVNGTKWIFETITVENCLVKHYRKGSYVTHEPALHA